jgi:mono/diheme cytochrome c family protein
MNRYSLLTVGALAAFAVIPVIGSTQSAKAPAPPTIKHEPAKPLTSLQGQDIYREYCAVCHGKEGKGDGPAARALKKAPADLTTITKRYGEFPRKTLEETILAENEPRPIAHGSRDMPIWGPIFRASGGRDVEALATANIINYIESLQAK